jgi:hypothetical protein
VHSSTVAEEPARQQEREALLDSCACRITDLKSVSSHDLRLHFHRGTASALTGVKRLQKLDWSVANNLIDGSLALSPKYLTAEVTSLHAAGNRHQPSPIPPTTCRFSLAHIFPCEDLRAQGSIRPPAPRDAYGMTNAVEIIVNDAVTSRIPSKHARVEDITGARSVGMLAFFI